MKLHYFIKRLLMCSASAASVALAAMTVPSAWADASEQVRIYTKADGPITGTIYGGDPYSGGGVQNCHVKVTDGATVTGAVYGGFSFDHNVQNNSVTINGGARVTATTAGIAGGYAQDGQGACANGNHLTISGAYVIRTDTVYGGLSNHGDASGNYVTLDNAHFEYENGTPYATTVFGGCSTASNGATENNTITLLSGDYSNITISGGNREAAGNTLVLDHFTGSLGNIENFEKILIITDLSNPVTLGPSETATWTLPDDVELSVEITPSEAGVAGNTPIEPGKKLALLSGLTVKPDLTDIAVEGIGQSAFFVCQVNLDVEETTGDNNITTYDVVLTAGDAELNPQTKSLAEGRVAAMQLNYRAADLVAAQGMEQAKRAAQGKHMGAFFAMSAGHDKVDSGSHVNVDGIATMLGISGKLRGKEALTIGGFVESGWGDYTTHNGFANGAVRGTGDSSYVGGGILLDYDLGLAKKALKGFSVNASLHAGRQETDFGTADMQGADRPVVGYDTDAHYISGHVGVNYSFSAKEKLTAMAYARYLWSRLGGDKAVSCGEQVDFDSMDSNRLQVGMRAEYRLCDHWSPYAGLAYEWECSGSARSSIQGVGVAAPSMRGGSLSGELGTTWQPNLDRPLWFNGGVQGVIGKREGYGANLGCTLGF